MKKLLEKILLAYDTTPKWIAVGLTVMVSGLLTLWGIYGWNYRFGPKVK